MPLLVVAVIGAGSFGATHIPWDDIPWSSLGGKSSDDSDGDGLKDELEQSGWATSDGTKYRTDAHKADTDGDGLSDGDEAGGLATKAKGKPSAVFAGYSHPLKRDTDGDELSDLDEADLSLDPLDEDTDGDGLRDGVEEKIVGTSPGLADTDDDGFDDSYEDDNREKQGLNPLAVDVKVSKWSYAADFAKGSLAGDLWREDSLAWIAGNMSSASASSIPIIGTIVGGLADLRDVIGSAIHADWVGSGFSAMGVVPGGDLVAIPGKVAKFVARNPELAASLSAILAAAHVPHAIKIKAQQTMWKRWKMLTDAGASDDALMKLAMGRTAIDRVGSALKGSTRVRGPKVGFLDWQGGEAYLERLYGVSRNKAKKQFSASTSACIDVCNAVRRRFDVLVHGQAHESKAGFQSWGESIQRQIQSDAWLVKNGQLKGAHWHFFASIESNTIGADPKVFALLKELGIKYTIHLPAKA